MASLSLGRLAILAIVLWLALLIYTSTVLVNVQKSFKNDDESGQVQVDKGDSPTRFDGRTSEVTDIQHRLASALSDIEQLRKQNKELKNLLASRNSSRVLSQTSKSKIEIDTKAFGSTYDFVVSGDHQAIRRSVQNGLIELSYAISSKLRKLKERFQSNSQDADAVKRIMDDLQEQHRVVLADSLKLSTADGSDDRRRVMLWNLTEIVQNRMSHLQNPADCANARKLVCQLNKGCGFGCQLHHVMYCLMVAYGTERTMILDSRGWRYSQRGWDSIFLPVSSSCRNITDDNAETWKGEEFQSNVKSVSLPIIDGLRPRPPYLPLSFPEEFSEKLLALHGDPPAWWVGQFVWYLMRYQEEFKKDLSTTANRIKFDAPCVGVHVRRTDKVGSEASFHALEEYMQFVEAWYRIEAIKNGTTSPAEFDSMPKRIYLATDEPSLYAQARSSYSTYTFIGDPQAANTAQLSSRYTDSSLRGVVSDIHFLSRCNYLVCTFSSQVCRVAYELMQVLRGDAAAHFHSLDNIYYFGGQEVHEQIAIFPHKATSQDEIDLQVGDVVGIAGNHWDGYSKGRNYRTNQVGLYPSYKVKEKWRIVKFPTYPNADATRQLR